MTEGFSIQLACGYEIRLKTLNQRLTHAGLLEGLPTSEMNQRIIEGALKKTQSASGAGIPYLIQPTETAIDYRRGAEYPFGNPAVLPGILCEARFESLRPVRDESQDYSWLIIVWFQKEFALPLAQDVEAKIKALEWKSIAHDGEY